MDRQLRDQEDHDDMERTKMKTLSLKCPSCGGKVELSADGKKATCPYCGHTILIEKEEYAKKEYERRMDQHIRIQHGI